jgi:menaquinone-9 beta-reductase
MNEPYDVIIIGAGPGGCSSAAFLSKAGYNVLLIERGRYPRDKTCGDGLSATAIPVLEHIGVLEKIEALNPWKCDGVIITSPDDVVMRGHTRTVPGGYNYGYVIPRKIFDNVLFEYVKELPHVTVIEECAFKDFIYEGGIIRGIRARHGIEEFEARCEFIIGADGVHSTVARKLGNHAKSSIKKAFAVRAYFENVDGLEHCISLHYEKAILPGYAWIFPTGERSANVGVGLICSDNSVKNIKNLFEIFIHQNSFAREKLKNAVMVEGSFKGAHLATGNMGVKRSFGNVLLVGDAAGFVDALTGEGIFYALKSGEHAARAIIQGLSGKNQRGAVCRLYDNFWRKEFRSDIIFGNIFQRVMTKKFIINLMVNRTSKNQAKADILSGVIQHALPKSRLFRAL